MTKSREIGSRTLSRAPHRLDEDEDLTSAECVAEAIRKAFPLPPSGAFTDLLAAIDGPRSSPRRP
jgi:hypothetical protein